MVEDNRSPFSRVLQGTFWTGGGRFVTLILGFLCIIIYTRWLTKEEYGTFVLFQVILGLASLFSDFGLGVTITKYLTGLTIEDAKYSLINSTLIFRLVTLSIIATIIYLCQGLFFQLFGPSLTHEVFEYIPFLVIIEGLLSFLSSVLSGLFKFEYLGFYEGLMSIISFIITAVLVCWFQYGVLGAVFARLISRFIALILTFYSSKIKLLFSFDWNSIRSMLRFGAPLYANQILSLSFTKLDTLIIGALLGPAEVAIYEIARMIPDSIEQIFDAFKQVYFSILSNHFSQEETDEVNYLLNHTVRLIAFICLFTTFGFILFGGEFVKLLFSEKYVESIPVINLLMIVLSLNLITYTLGYTLVAIGEPKKPPIINIIRNMVLFPLYFLLIPVIGVFGAAISNIIGISISNPINAYFIRKKGVDLNIFSYLKAVLIFTDFYLFSLFFPIPNLAIKIGIFILYIIVNVIFFVVTPKDVTVVWREIRKRNG